MLIIKFKEMHRNTDFRPSTANTTIGRPSILSYSLATVGKSSALNIPGQSGKQGNKIPKPQKLNDDRNLREKEVHPRIIKRIREFVDSYETNFQCTDRMLKSPSINEFKQLFEFIFNQFEPGYAAQNIEEDIINMMPVLGYPYPLKRSTLKTVGAPHSWPLVLGLLDWLLDLIEIQEKQEPLKLNDKEALAVNFVNLCFRKQMESGGDSSVPLSFEQEIAAYRQSAITEGIEEEYDELRARRAFNNQHIEFVEEKTSQTRNDISSTSKSIGTYHDDIKQINTYISGLTVKIDEFNEHMEKLDTNIKQMEECVEKITTENNRKNQVIKCQKMNGEEARSLRLKLKTLIEQKKSTCENLSVQEKKRFEYQPRVDMKVNEVSTQFETLRLGLRELISSLVPEENRVEMIRQVSSLQISDVLNSQHGAPDSLKKLIDKIDSFVDIELDSFKSEEINIAHRRDDEMRYIRQLESAREEKSLQHKGRVREMRRELDDLAEPIRQIQTALESAKANQKSASESLQLQIKENNNLTNEYADMEKLFSSVKNEYGDMLASCEKVYEEKNARLYEDFQQIKEARVIFESLCREILDKNISFLKENKVNVAKLEKVSLEMKNKDTH